MNFHTKVRDFVVGIDYDSIEEDKGYFTIRRKVTLSELITELKEIHAKWFALSTVPCYRPIQLLPMPGTLTIKRMEIVIMKCSMNLKKTLKRR